MGRDLTSSGKLRSKRQYKGDEYHGAAGEETGGDVAERLTWYVGIDWGSETHAVCVVDATGLRREERRVDHTVEAVQACLDWVMSYTGVPPSQIAVAIETPRGALVDSCIARATSWISMRCAPS